MSIVGVACKRTSPHHEAVCMGDHNRSFNPKLIRLAGLTFANALHLWGMHGVQLVFVFGSLFVHTCCSGYNRAQALFQVRCCAGRYGL